MKIIIEIELNELGLAEMRRSNHGELQDLTNAAKELSDAWAENSDLAKYGKCICKLEIPELEGA